MAYVYRHIRLDKNEPFYIGIGSDSNGNHKRAYQNKDRRNKIWNDIVNKTDYKVDILFDDITIKEAIKKEIEFIELYGRISFGNGTLANLTDGGDGVSGYVHTNESKKKMSECRSGSNNPMRGFSQNVKHQPTKMSISVSGRVAKCVTSAAATAAQTAVPLARLPITHPPSPRRNCTAERICSVSDDWFLCFRRPELIAPKSSSQA